MDVVRDWFDECFFFTDKERLIGRRLNADGVDHHLIAVTCYKGKTSLWMLHEEEKVDRSLRRHKIFELNRDMVEESYHVEGRSQLCGVREIVFGEEVFKVRGSSSGSLLENQGKYYSVLQHFLEGGMSGEFLRKLKFEHVFVTEFELDRDESFDLDSLEFDGEIVVRTFPGSRKLSVKVDLKLPMGDYEKPVVVEVPDPENECMVSLYINGVENYDIWDKWDQEREKPDGMSEDDFVRWKKLVFDNYKIICPRGKNLAFVKYEMDIRGSVTMYSKKWLDEPVRKGEGGLGLIFSTIEEGEKGLMGKPMNVCKLDPVDKEFDGVVEVEIVKVIETVEEREFVFGEC